MHYSASETGKLFFTRYCGEKNLRVLEVGSLDVNGSLKDFCKPEYDWIGVDIEPGKGVDIVLEDPYKLPFDDRSFDVILATSVFEHASHFWLLFDEMVRVMSTGGLIYINAPSNGFIHRYPVDVFRFYPDAGKALQSWGQRNNANLFLQESFIAEQNGDPWNDFVAIFTDAPRMESPIFLDINSRNVWHKDNFVLETFSELPQDFRNIHNLENENEKLLLENQQQSRHIKYIENSVSWKLTVPLRLIRKALSKLLK